MGIQGKTADIIIVDDVQEDRSKPLVTLNEDVYDLPENARVNLNDLLKVERDYGFIPQPWSWFE